MANEVKSGISGGAIVGIVLVVGALGGGVLLYEWSQAKNKEYDALLKDYQNELSVLITYQANSPTSSGIQTMTNAMRVKELRLQGLNTSWPKDLANSAKEVFESFGLYVVLPLGGLFIAGYVIFWLVKEIYRNRPKGGGGGTYRCEKDGSTFTTPDALFAYEQQHFQPTTDPASIVTAQAAFNGLANWVQNTMAATAGVYQGAYRDWSTLPGQQVMSLGWAFEAMFGMGIITDPSLALMAALLMW